MTRSPLDYVWRDSDDGAMALVATALAIALHVGLAGLVRRLPVDTEQAPAAALEVDLASVEPAAVREPEPRPPEPEAQPSKEPDPPAGARPEPARTERVVRAREPPPASAGALVTAADDSDAPVRFVTDPSGSTYASGVVAASGAGVGRGGQGAAPAPGPSMDTSPTPRAVDGSRRPTARGVVQVATPPRLAEANPCRGSFPRGATADVGEAKLAMSVDDHGAPLDIRVVREQPADQGFGDAAVRCLRDKRLVPARDATGAAVRAPATILVRFSR